MPNSRHNAECLMAERYAHVATVLSPAYKLMTHMQHVQTYSETDKDALLTVANAFGVLAPETCIGYYRMGYLEVETGHRERAALAMLF